MATTKVTFTLDNATISRLEDAAKQKGVPKSEVVREAISEYHQRHGRISETERIRRLRVFDELMARIPPRPQADADREIAEIRRARRQGGRRHPV